MGHRFVDQDQNRDRHRGAALVHPDADPRRLGGVSCDQGWRTKNDPCDHRHSDVVHHQVVGRGRHRADDEQGAVVRDCHQAVAESCDHQQERFVDQE